MEGAHECLAHVVGYGADGCSFPYPPGRQVAHPCLFIALWNKLAFHTTNMIGKIYVLGARHSVRQACQAKAFMTGDKLLMVLSTKSTEQKFNTQFLTLFLNDIKQQSGQKPLV